MMQPSYHNALGRAESSTRASERADFFWKTYQWMTVGLALTAGMGWVVANTPALASLILGNQILFFGLIIAELGLVIAFSSMAHRVSFAKAAAMFLGYSLLNGVTFSVIFLAYTQESIVEVFLISASGFAALSVFGMVTKRDLGPVGTFMGYGVFGLIAAMVVNMFLHSDALANMISYAGVLIFAALTAYDTQKLKELFASQGAGGNLALRGALTLYLDFINLFLFLLRIMGRRR